MPAVLALPAFWAAIGGTAAATGAIVAAHESSGATTDAANITSAATSHAADLTAQGNAATLAYEKDQAAQTQANFNTTQKANYDQWAASQARKSAYGQMFGAPAQTIPSYVPPTDTTASTLGSMATAPTSTTTTPGSASSTSSSPTDPNAITSALQANYKALGAAPTGPGTGPTDLSYYATQIANTGGLTPQNSAYWFGPTGRIATDLSKASGGASGAPAAPAVAPSTAGAGTLGAYLTPIASPITGNLTMPQPGTLASYAGAH
jgi:hypothetical protein